MQVCTPGRRAVTLWMVPPQKRSPQIICSIPLDQIHEWSHPWHCAEQVYQGLQVGQEGWRCPVSLRLGFQGKLKGLDLVQLYTFETIDSSTLQLLTQYPSAESRVESALTLSHWRMIACSIGGSRRHVTSPNRGSKLHAYARNDKCSAFNRQAVQHLHSYQLLLYALCDSVWHGDPSLYLNKVSCFIIDSVIHACDLE